MAARNDEAIQMAVDYLLSADGASPIEVQLSFLKSRMKMSHTDITEALRLTGLKPSSTAAGPTAQQSVVQQAGPAATAPETAPDGPRAGYMSQLQQAAEAEQRDEVAAKDVETEPPRSTTQPLVVSSQAQTQAYMTDHAKTFRPGPSLVTGFGSRGAAMTAARSEMGIAVGDRAKPLPEADARRFTKIGVVGAETVAPPAPAPVPTPASPNRHFQPQFSIGTSSRANMNNSRKSAQWGDDQPLSAMLGGKSNAEANRRRPASGRRAHRGWSKEELRTSMDAPPAGSGARRMTVAQRMYETAPISMGGTQPGSPGGHGRTGKFSQQQSIYRPRPDLVEMNDIGQYHETGMDPAAACITDGIGYGSPRKGEPAPRKEEEEQTGWHHEEPARVAPTAPPVSEGWHNTEDRNRGRGGRAGRQKASWGDANKGGDAMSGILGGGGGMSWGLGASGEIKASTGLLPSIGGNSPGRDVPPSGRYSLVSGNRAARLAGNSPRDLPPSAMFKPSQMDPRDFDASNRMRYTEPVPVTGYVSQYISS